MMLAALSIGTAPVLANSFPVIAASQEVRLAAPNQKSGKAAISSLRQTYENGGYEQFLKKLDDSYQAAQEKNQLEALGEMRSGFSPQLQEWEAKGRVLQEEKNRELLAAVLDQKPSSFVEKVRSAAASLSNERQQAAIDRMAMFRQMVPGTGKNSDENLMIALDLEYEYKSTQIDLPGASMDEKRAKQCVLKMEKLDRILQLSKQFQDASLKDDLNVYAEQFDARLAQSWDIADLNGLASGKTKPECALEEKIARILVLYQEKFSDLTQQLVADAKN